MSASADGNVDTRTKRNLPREFDHFYSECCASFFQGKDFSGRGLTRETLEKQACAFAAAKVVESYDIF